LSGGELRYLEIKLILNMPAKFILLDEPFNGVSPILMDAIKQLLEESSKTKGIILTDHDFRNVLSITNRNYLLIDGSLKTINDPRDLIKWGYLTEQLFDY